MLSLFLILAPPPREEAKRRKGNPGGKQDLAFRESAQDLQPDRGERNKKPGRRTRKSGSPLDR